VGGVLVSGAFILSEWSMNNKIKRFIIDVCEAIITWLDPVRVKECRFETESISASLTGYLPKGEYRHVVFTLSAWMKHSDSKKDASIAEVELFVGGESKEKRLAYFSMREGYGSSS
jgi:hypothetical protein